jgi:hypothetical protein
MKTIAASSSANRCGSAQFRGDDGSFILHIRNRAIERRQSFCRVIQQVLYLARRKSAFRQFPGTSRRKHQTNQKNWGVFQVDFRRIFQF